MERITTECVRISGHNFSTSFVQSCLRVYSFFSFSLVYFKCFQWCCTGWLPNNLLLLFNPICTVNQLTGFYMRATLALNGLNWFAWVVCTLKKISVFISHGEAATFSCYITYPGRQRRQPGTQTQGVYFIIYLFLLWTNLKTLVFYFLIWVT